MYLQSLLEEASAGDLFAWGSALVVAYIITTVTYRLYFHPLAKYPGPFWARVSSFPSYWHTLKKDRHIWLWRLQEEYGKHYSHLETGPWTARVSRLARAPLRAQNTVMDH